VLLLSCVARCYHRTADTRRAGCSIRAVSLRTQLPSNVCTLYLVFKEPRTIGLFQSRFPPQTHASNFLDNAPALFGGTFQTYDDLPSLVNPFFAYRRKTFRRLPGSATL